MDKKNKRYLKLEDEDYYFDSESVVSSTECTGLMQTPPISVDEAECYTDIYDVPQPKNEVNNGLQHE